MDWLFDASADGNYSLELFHPNLSETYATLDPQTTDQGYFVSSEKDEWLSFALYSAPCDPGYPTGCVAYGDGGYYMRCPDGSIRLTPQWQEQVEGGELNWAGIAADFAIIVGSGVSILGVWGAAVGGVIVAGAEAVEEMADRQRDLDGGAGATGDND